MNQEERLDYLIESLCDEEERLWGLKPVKRSPESSCQGMRPVGRPPETEVLKKQRLLRSLMNVRPPRPVSDTFLRIQDEYLSEELKRKGIVEWSGLPTVEEALGSGRAHADRISIWKGDITRLVADAIVNAANSQLLGCFVPCHGCIDNAIHSAAGIQLREACSRIMEKQGYEEPVGSAKITPGYNLPSRFVLHTVGPVAGMGLMADDCAKLKSCYEACLRLAEENGLESLAFCCISTGEFHFPNGRAAQIAIEAVTGYLDHCPALKRIIFNVFKQEDEELYLRYFGLGEGDKA